jgi:hypothetical protein
MALLAAAWRTGAGDVGSGFLANMRFRLHNWGFKEGARIDRAVADPHFKVQVRTG